ncbi:MAG: hypothetical protein ACTSVY_09210 [Candidatus Helarchaeota archaeon]
MLRIPIYVFESLMKWINIPETEKEKLFEELGKITPTLNFDEIIDELRKKVDIERNLLRDIFHAFLSIYLNLNKYNLSYEEFINEIYQSIKEIKPEKIYLEEKNKEIYTKLIEKIATLDQTIGILSKAVDVWTDHAITYFQSRILTDLRPIYSKKVEKAPKNAVLIHNLKIEYMKDFNTRSFFVAMDSNDLLELKNVIDRAILKQKSLLTLCEEKNINVLGAKR